MSLMNTKTFVFQNSEQRFVEEEVAENQGVPLRCPHKMWDINAPVLSKVKWKHTYCWFPSFF